MILTGHEIKREVGEGKIQISPFEEKLLNPNSYNYRLGKELKVFDQEMDAYQGIYASDIIIPPEGFILLPGHLYLGRTMEAMGSTHYVPSLIGRSSLGRLGLWLQVTADLGNLGSCQNWTLELKVVQPLRVYEGMRIGQVTFWSVQGNSNMKYSGKYQGDTQARTSEIIQEAGQ